MQDFTGALWIKSSRSQNMGQCVEVAKTEGWVGIRDSKLGDASPVLALATATATAFLVQLKAS
jgi:hypothetical protein